MSVTRVFHEGCQAQWMWQAVCFRHVCPLLHDGMFSQFYLHCATSFDIDIMLWHEWKLPWHNNFTGMSLAKDVAKSAAKSTAKSAAKNAAKKRGEKSTTENSCLGFVTDCFHFGLGILLATRFLDPFPWRSGSVAGSLSVQTPLSNINAAECAKGLHPPQSWCDSD